MAAVPALSGYQRVIGLAGLEQMIGEDLGCSGWRVVDQEMIDAFAALTGDFNFLHVDEALAAKTEFGGTIAHGFLTLSLVAPMGYEVCPSVEGTRQIVNYGFNRIRFIAAVKAGSRVRARFRLDKFEQPAPDRWQSTFGVSVEIEGSAKPALVAEWVTAGFL